MMMLSISVFVAEYITSIRIVAELTIDCRLRQCELKHLPYAFRIRRPKWLEAGWWTGRDLNPGPLGCKPSALPG